MTAITIASPVLGAIVSVPPLATDVNITTPTPPENYYFFAQTSEPLTCWQSGLTASGFTASLQSPADNELNLNYILVNRSNTNAGAVVVDSGATSQSLPFNSGYTVFVMPTWETQVWIQSNSYGCTVFFSSPPPANSYIYYYGILNSGIGAATEPVDPSVYNATVTLLAGANYVPFAMASWNTAIGATPAAANESLFLEFSTPAPADSTGRISYFTQFIEPLPPETITPTVPEQQPLVVTALTQSQLETRIDNLYPYPWLGSTARSSSGVAYALFWAFAAVFAYIQQQIAYGWSAQRLQTANDTELDLFSEDYFGDQLPRLPGESDAHFRQRIQALLFQPKVTRAAIQNAIQFFTGGTARMIEPWNPGDTGYFGTSAPYIGSYFDYDTEQVPSLWGDPSLRYQGFIQIELPPAQGGTVNIWGLDEGSSYDIFTAIAWDTSDQFSSQEAVVNQLISYLIALGTTAWVKYVNGFIFPVTQGALINIATGIFTITINLPNLAGLYGFFAQLSLPTPVWVEGYTYSGFTLNFRAPTSTGTYISYLALEVGNETLYTTSVTPGSFTLSISDNLTTNALMAMPTWNSNVYYTNRTNTGITLNFDTPPEVDSLLYYTLQPVNPNVGFQAIPALADNHTVVLTLDGNHVPFGLASWNTQVGVNPDFDLGQVTFAFSNPAPADGSGELMFLCIDVNTV